MMSNSQIFSESNSVKVFVVSRRQHFPNLLSNISSVKSKIGNWEGREEGVEWGNRNYYYYVLAI